MKTFIVSVEESSKVRGFNQTIKVYRMIKNTPNWIGTDDRINTASSYGVLGEARILISAVTGIRLKDGKPYDFESSNVQVFKL